MDFHDPRSGLRWQLARLGVELPEPPSWEIWVLGLEFVLLLLLWAVFHFLGK